ncbi:CotD family spore coat protein [Bacillus sp. C1]
MHHCHPCFGGPKPTGPICTAPPVVHPTKQCVTHTFSTTVVPHIHPVHTTHVHHQQLKSQHYFPQTQSNVNVVDPIDPGFADSGCGSFGGSPFGGSPFGGAGVSPFGGAGGAPFGGSPFGGAGGAPFGGSPFGGAGGAPFGGPNVSPFGPNAGPNVSPFGPNAGPNVGGTFKK